MKEKLYILEQTDCLPNKAVCLHFPSITRIVFCENAQDMLVVVILTRKGLLFMGRRRSIMSDQLKEEIAKELGFYDTVQKEGWGGIKAKDAGNMVKRAIEIAEESVQEKGKP